MAHLRIDNVALRFGGKRPNDVVTALERISLDVADQEFAVIVGPSGCGKTSLLRLVAGLIEPSEGAITLDGTPVIGPGRDRGMVFQSYTLGAGRRAVVTQVLIPATLPGVFDTLRVTLGWAWTYLVVAELVAANKGLGYFILSSMRGLFTDRIFLGIITIGLLGLITDQLFKLARARLLPWASNP